MKRQVVTIFFLAFLTSCLVQTKVGVLNIDKRVHIDTIQSLIIDTSQNELKGQYLYQVTIKGHIDKFKNDTISNTIDYLEKIIYKQTIVYYKRKIFIDIVPVLSTTKNSEPIRSFVKYNYLADKTEFVFFEEKKITIPKNVNYKIISTCGEKTQTIWIFKTK